MSAVEGPASEVAPQQPNRSSVDGVAVAAAEECGRSPAVRLTNDYDAFAEAYAAENETSLANAYYERPAMLALAGDVSDCRVLDAGCGSGPLSALLRDRGAVVTGIDVSAGMLAIAERRLGDDVALHLADLRRPLPFEDGAFDLVVASLVLHYLEDWGPALAEFRRVLAPGGRLIASVDHPIVAYTMVDPRPDYFATTSYTFEWWFGGRSMPMTFWRKPIHAMIGAFTAAGFHVTSIDEPQPEPVARELDPDKFRDLSTRPGFMFFVVEAPSP